MKVKDITPTQFSCGVGACPAVFRTDQGTFLLVGRALTSSEIARLIPGRVSVNERAVEIPEELARTLSQEFLTEGSIDTADNL